MDIDALVVPDAIDGAFVARPLGTVAEVAVGDELVLVADDGRATVVNPTGALIWACLDGTSPLDEVVTDLSEELGADRAVVEADVLAFARQLGDAGLLEGVGYPTAELDWDLVPWEPPTAVAVGEELPDFELADLDGARHRLSDARGREVLLVNWSPSCGFCTMIAERLGAWAPALAERDVTLVFATRGDVDANRAVFDAAHLDVLVLVLEDGVDPFSGYGTPAAYHLDAEGRVVEPLAVGAFDVPALAAALAGVDPDGESGTASPDELERADPAPEGIRYLPVGGGTCGPGGAGSGAGSTNATEWAGLHAYRIGDHHVGVRYNSERTAATLDALFDGAPVRDPRVRDSYAVALYDDAEGAARPLDLLVQGSEQLVRSRSAARVLRALLWRLTDDVGGVDLTTGRLRVRATAARRGDEGLLLPPGLYRWAKQLQPRFARVGIALADVPHPEIDLATGELVLPDPAIPHDAGVLTAVDDGVRLGAEPLPVGPGRLPLAAWFLARADGEHGALTPAVAAVAAVPAVLGDHDIGERVAELGALFTRTQAVGIVYDSEAALVDAVAAALT